VLSYGLKDLLGAELKNVLCVSAGAGGHLRVVACLLAVPHARMRLLLYYIACCLVPLTDAVRRKTEDIPIPEFIALPPSSAQAVRTSSARSCMQTEQRTGQWHREQVFGTCTIHVPTSTVGLVAFPWLVFGFFM
jgi:hypothetical protein